MDTILDLIFTPLAAAVVMMFYVGFRAFQQRNVAFDAPWYAIMPISYGMAAADAYIVVTFVRVGYDLTTILAIGTGAGIGAIFAMKLHRKIFGTQKK